METINTPSLRRTKPDSTSVRLFHKIAVLTVLAGAGASVGFTIYTGRDNSSFLLILLFVGWVLAPFIAFLLVNVVATRWSVLKRLTLHSLMLLVTIGSLVMYSGLWSVPDAKPAFVFLIVPLLSWFFMGTAVLIAATMPNKN
jgi:hypothetical protein